MKYTEKRTTLYLILCSIFITNALVAEIIGVKIFSLEQLLEIAPAQITLLLEHPLDFNLTAGVILWPVVFITSDIINEYFGKDGVKRISVITACLISYTFIAIISVTQLPPAQFWLDVNTPNGFNINTAFEVIFRQGLGIMIASITAFLIGQFLDAYVFHYLKGITGNKKIWLRATGSTLVSQLVDSFVVIIIAFKVFGSWSWEQVISVSVMNYIYKCIMAVALTPLLYLMHYLIDLYLGEKESQELVEEADKSY